MQYIIHRRFRGKALCGEVNLPARTICESINGVIYRGGKPLCAATSENAHQYFAADYDGQGIERGRLTQAIQKELQTNDRDHQARWDMVWLDERCQAYRRKEHGDHWLWNDAFFNAPIAELQRIAKLVGTR